MMKVTNRSVFCLGFLKGRKKKEKGKRKTKEEGGDAENNKVKLLCANESSWLGFARRKKLSSGKLSFWENSSWESDLLGNGPSGKFPPGKPSSGK